MNIYLDEAGDLGFDFINKCPSRYFVITLLQIESQYGKKVLNKSVAKILKKLNHRKKRFTLSELKGTNTTLSVKRGFLAYLRKHTDDWKIYSIILDKQQLLNKRPNPRKDILYNQMSHQILEQVDFSRAVSVNLIVDKSKNKFGIREFNDHLYINLSLFVNVDTKLYISHNDSIEIKELQAVDLFCYGISRKYEKADLNWYNEYKDKIAVECEFKA